MPRNDKLYEESRSIRKAVNEGKKTVEIMQMMSLTASQIKYRIETRYTEAIAKSILRTLAKNDEEVKTEQEKSKQQNKEIKSIVVDTCALKCKGAFEFIMGYESVILLVDVVKQLDNHKNDEGIFGKNIRSLLNESAKDYVEKKIKVRTAGKQEDCTDSKLLDYCSGKDVVLYTADNALATLARFFGIKYILAKDLEDSMQNNSEYVVKDEVPQENNVICNETSTSEIEVTQANDDTINLSSLDLETLKKQMQYNSIMKQQTTVTKNTIKNVYLSGKSLLLNMPDTYRIKYLVIENDEVKHPLNNVIVLKQGYVIAIVTYKQEQSVLQISRYEITDITNENHAIYLGTDRVIERGQIDKMDLPDEAKRELKQYFSLVKK